MYGLVKDPHPEKGRAVGRKREAAQQRGAEADATDE